MSALDAGAGGLYDVTPIIRILKSPAMLNKLLIQICKTEGLGSSGVKADFQQRITDRLRLYAAQAMQGQPRDFMRLKTAVEAAVGIAVPPNGYGPPPSRPGYSVSPAVPVSMSHTPHNGTGSSSRHMPTPLPHMPVYANGNAQRGVPAPIRTSEKSKRADVPDVGYKSSPFYTLRTQIGPTIECEIMSNHKHTAHRRITMNDIHIHGQPINLAANPEMRVMVFCSDSRGLRQDITFPHNCELKVNGGEVKANLRGLKNKPGSTRPVDITALLRQKPPTYANSLELTFALTQKTFYMSTWLVQMTPVATLVKRLETGQKLSRDSILREMMAKASDPDIEATSIVLSLKCPLSTLRMDVPVRGIGCKHNQCFDAASYLQLQEQAPTWLCPHCNNAAPFERLAVDEYVRDILRRTSASTDQVTVEPNGKWSTSSKTSDIPAHGRSSNTTVPNHGEALLVDLDDGSSGSDVTQSGFPQRFHSGALLSMNNTLNTPLKREHSGSMAAMLQAPLSDQNLRRPSAKRPAAEIVDLTLSDDDEDEPPAKRPHHNPQYSSPIGTTYGSSASQPRAHTDGLGAPNGAHSAYRM